MRFNRLKKQITVFNVMVLFAVAVFAEPDESLGLTKAERVWLKNHSVIRLASDISWPPFEWINSEMQYQGIAADYMKLIETKLGIRFEVDKTKPWSEVVAAVKKHELDVFSCVAKNPQREKFVNFTRPYLSFPMVIVTTNDVNYIDGIKGMQNMHVSVVQGYATHDYLVANHPEIKLHLVKTSAEGLQAVSQGKVDAYVDNIATATSIIQTKGLTNLKISGEMPIRYELSMAVRKDWPEFVNILQRALDSISDEQRKQIHNKWIGVRYEYGFDYSLFWKSLIVFLLIVGSLYLYNRKLSNEVTKRRLAEEKAIEALNEADKANQAKSEFLSVMSHELRTPLTSIKGSLGLLLGGKIVEVPKKAQEMLDVANQNCDRLTLLINDILDTEKLLAGKLTFNNDTVVMGDLIQKATTANQGYADQYGVSFTVENHGCDNDAVIADENRLMQVFSNLLSNAVKYSPKGGNVRIMMDCTANKVRVSVIDQGKGIPPEFRGRIFTRFSQADSSDTREKGGTGLGLSIAKDIIERLGGNIGFTSSPGEGATFYFELNKG